MPDTGLTVTRATLQGMLDANYQYLCPLYQRPFVWVHTRMADGNLDMLWDDIDTVIDGSQSVRFLGAVVFDVSQPPSSSESGERWIIDGQQRITTLYLALLALTDVSREVNPELFRDTLTKFLATTTMNDQGLPKLRPTIPDTKQFNNLLLRARGDNETLKVLEVSTGPDTGVLTDAFEFHSSKIRDRARDENGNLDPSKLADIRRILLEKLEFAEIEIGDHHDPTEVFDRLNRGGEPLSLVDLVRNEALKPVRKLPVEAKDVYDHHWMRFEDDFLSPAAPAGDDAATRQARKRREGYLFPFTLIVDDSITKARIYKTLVDYWARERVADDPPAQQSRAVIEHLRSFAPEFVAVNDGIAPASWDTDLKEVVRRMHSILPTVTFPYLMRLLKAVDEQEVAVSDALACFGVVDSFLVRRGLMGIEPTGLHAVFKKLWAWTEGHAEPALVREKIVTNTVRFPNDAETRQAVLSEPLYTRRISQYVVGEYERGLTGDDEVPVEFTIDHVLPQEPIAEWLSLFSEVERKAWTHRWANLVPLTRTDNARIGQGSWEETRQKLDKARIHFRSTADVYDSFEEWNVEALQQRSEMLAEFAVGRWPGDF